jgi:hypothetical protein
MAFACLLALALALAQSQSHRNRKPPRHDPCYFLHKLERF